MSYKTNYELWNPALSPRRPSQMSEIDVILSQTYPHVAMLPYMQCQHCNPYDEHQSQPGSPTSLTGMSSIYAESEEGLDYIPTSTQSVQSSSGHTTSIVNDKGKSLRRRLQKLLSCHTLRSKN